MISVPGPSESRRVEAEPGLTIFRNPRPFSPFFIRLFATSKGKIMDKDRIAGVAKQVKGEAKEIAGKVTGDAKLQTDGAADKAAGKIQNTLGGIKDTLRGK